MQGRLAASEEKVEQLSQQVALLQMMVDSHQRALQDLEDQDFEDAGTGKIDAQSLPTVSDSQIVPATPREKSAPTVVEVVEETLASENAPQVTEEIEPVPPALEESGELQQESTTRIPANVAAPTDDAPNPQYQEVMEIFRSGDYETAGPLFETFAEEFPEDELADNALYWAGECKYTKKKFTEAIKRFKRVVEEYPDGSKVPDAMLKIGFAYISLGDTGSAETYLKKVVAQYPFSTAGAKAEERLKKLQGQ
jgi:tol-pal system protein YbgF